MSTSTRSDPYRHADKALKRLFRQASARFQHLAVTASWDELNVITAVQEIYSEVEQEAEKQYLEVAEKAYADARDEILAELPDRKPRFSLPTMAFIAALLLAYDKKTQYVYRHEVDRKRARLSESLIAVNGQGDIFNSLATRQALLRALKLFERQMRNMADTVTDEARLQAFEDAGIDEGIWFTQHDEKVCKICRERDGVKYPLYDIPPKHPNCRCYILPVHKD